jgi:hypothetical protein
MTFRSSCFVLERDIEMGCSLVAPTERQSDFSGTERSSDSEALLLLMQLRCSCRNSILVDGEIEDWKMWFGFLHLPFQSPTIVLGQI